MTTTSLTADQFQVGHIDAKDKYGNPASVQGDWVWVSANPDIMAVDAPSPGVDVTITAAGPGGAFTVTGTADADLGDGVVRVIAVISGVVTSGMAATVDVALDAPQAKP